MGTYSVQGTESLTGNAVFTNISEYSHGVPTMRNVSVRNPKYTNIIAFCVLTKLRDAEIAPQARADDRGDQRVLHGAGVEDTHHGAGPGRRDRAEERPVQPILSVQLDDLRKHPRNARYGAVTRGADAKKHFLPSFW